LILENIREEILYHLKFVGCPKVGVKSGLKKFENIIKIKLKFDNKINKIKLKGVGPRVFCACVPKPPRLLMHLSWASWTP
jgi:hypothetical protein